MNTSLKHYVNVLHQLENNIIVDGEKADLLTLNSTHQNIIMTKFIEGTGISISEAIQEGEKHLLDDFLSAPTERSYDAIFKPLWKRYGKECTRDYNECVDKLMPARSWYAVTNNVISNVNFGG